MESLVRRVAIFAAAFVLFAVLATANAGGYRYGVSDQAFYVPAISLRADPALFPRDREVFEPQMRLWLGDEILGAVVRTTGVSLPVLFGGIYIVTMAALFGAVLTLARTLGLGWPATSLAVVVMTLRHRIAKTGANSFEGYMHPRMLAFAVGIFALAMAVRRKWTAAALLVVVAAIIHTSTAIWFAGVVAVAALWTWPRRVPLLVTAAVAAILVVIAGPVAFPGLFPRMGAEWLTVLGDRDYLFSLDWPAYAWVLNLSYVALLAMLLGLRVRSGAASTGEPGVMAGLFALVVVFLATLPGTAGHVALFVTLQANRVFWLLDAMLAVLGAWWLFDVLPRTTHRRAGAVVAVLVGAFAIARGVYVLETETNRKLVQPALPPTAWTETMRWLETQPASWNVLADPGHAWKFGSSIRVAARRDTPLELGKDPAMAMYDESLARRVRDRSEALAAFDSFTIDDVRRLDARYEFDVFVDTTRRHFALPELFRNRDFVAYDLR
jgi:hypothetical protein